MSLKASTAASLYEAVYVRVARMLKVGEYAVVFLVQWGYGGS